MVSAIPINPQSKRNSSVFINFHYHTNIFFSKAWLQVGKFIWSLCCTTGHKMAAQLLLRPQGTQRTPLFQLWFLCWFSINPNFAELALLPKPTWSRKAVSERDGNRPVPQQLCSWTFNVHSSLGHTYRRGISCLLVWLWICWRSE